MKRAKYGVWVISTRGVDRLALYGTPYQFNEFALRCLNHKEDIICYHGDVGWLSLAKRIAEMVTESSYPFTVPVYNLRVVLHKVRGAEAQ